jgi:hypothetical protein
MSSLQRAQHLFTTIVSLREKLLHSAAHTAPNFNLFEILGVGGKEVSTHSAFLAHLLDPRETHAQGDLFLRGFLTTIGYEKLASFDDWVVSKELPFDDGRLDIVLQSTSASAIIVIENKIDTQDDVNQLEAYNGWLNTPQRQRFFRVRLLFYLTPKGDPAKYARIQIYTPISYSNDVRRWLSSCDVKPSKVRESIESYLGTVRKLTTEKLMKEDLDDLDDKILDLIKTPTDRAVALRIARIGNFLKQQTLQEFWDQGEVYLDRKLKDQKLTHWKLDRSEGAPLDQAGYGIDIIGKNIDPKRPHPRFSFFQWRSPKLFRWEWTVTFNTWIGSAQKISNLPEAKKLAGVMDASCSMPKKHGWDGYRLFTDDSKGMERTLEQELTKGSQVSEFFEGGWKIFERLEPHLRRLNAAVGRM